MLIPNVLFRCNGSAVLLTNKSKHIKRAKYSIPHIVRTNLAANDVAFNCVMQTEDAERKLGVRLNKDLIQVGCSLCICLGTAQRCSHCAAGCLGCSALRRPQHRKQHIIWPVME